MTSEQKGVDVRDAIDARRYRKLRKVTPYRFKKLQDACTADAGDTLYFLADRFDALVDALPEPQP